MPRNRYYQGPPSDHFDGTRFFNPGQAPVDRGLGDMLRWKLGGGGAARWPAAVPVVQVRPAPRVTGLRITMVGHASPVMTLRYAHRPKKSTAAKRMSAQMGLDDILDNDKDQDPDKN